MTARRGGGGLIGAVAPVMERLGGTWIASALTDGDRRVAAAAPNGREQDGFTLRILDMPRDVHDLHYGVVSNEYLWFLFHYLFDLPSQPVFDAHFERAWDAYRHVNDLYADAVASERGGRVVVVHDYHLMLVGTLLRRRRVRRPIVYFHHTPWCEPEYFGLLPEDVRTEILHGLLSYDVVGFHARRWADAFGECCRRFLPGVRVTTTRVEFRRRQTRIIVSPVPIDVPRLQRDADGPLVEEWARRHDEARGGRKLLVRVDRIDLSKNPVRGFLAFEQLLERRPRLAREVLFLALMYPSRLTVESYRRYYAECTRVVRRINDRFGEHEPVALHFEDDYQRSLGAMRIYDVLLVNPIFDGLNLVSKEGATANRRDGVIVLSRNAGVFEEIGPATIAVNPFDVAETADAIERALEMPRDERRRLSARARRLAQRSTPEGWARAQLHAAGVAL